MGVAPVEGLLDLPIALVGDIAVPLNCARLYRGQVALRRQVDLLPVALVPVQAADVRCREHRPASDGLLNACAVLRNSRRRVLLVDSGYAGRHDGYRNRTAGPRGARVGQENVT
jgi:hypothetical protein